MGRSQLAASQPGGALNSDQPQLRQTAMVGPGFIGGAETVRELFR